MESSAADNKKGKSMKTIKRFIPTLVVAVVCIVSISEALAGANDALSARQEKIIPIAALTASGNIPKHVAISAPRNDSTVEWMEHVNDEQYGK
jgi:hypothetical protein